MNNQPDYQPMPISFTDLQLLTELQNLNLSQNETPELMETYSLQSLEGVGPEDVLTMEQMQNLDFFGDMWEAVSTPVKGIFSFGKKAVKKHRKSLIKDMRYAKNYIKKNGKFLGADALADGMNSF